LPVPLYEYQCRKCRHRFEKIEKVSGPHVKKCPKCGASVERLVAVSAIQFKGSGWYATDYAGKGAAASDSKGGEAAKGEKTEKESKEAAPAKETKKAQK